MDLDWKNNKFLWVVAAVFVINIALVGHFILVRQVTNSVVNKLQREYSPGHAVPGLDPDKINPNISKGFYEDLERRQQETRRVLQEQSPSEAPRPEVAGLEVANRVANLQWRQEWERERGVEY